MNAYWNHYFFHSVESTTACPTWLGVALIGLVVAFGIAVITTIILVNK